MSKAWPALAARSAWLPGLAARWAAPPASSAAAGSAPPAWRQLVADPGLVVQAHWLATLPPVAAAGAPSGLDSDTTAMRRSGLGAAAAGPAGAAAWLAPLQAGRPQGDADGLPAPPGAAGPVLAQRVPPAQPPATGAGPIGAPSALQWLSAARSARRGSERSPGWWGQHQAAPTATAEAGGAAAGAGLDAAAGGAATAATAPWPPASAPAAPVRQTGGPAPGATAAGAQPAARGRQAGIGSLAVPHAGQALGGSLGSAGPADSGAGAVHPPSPVSDTGNAPIRLAQGAAGLGRLLSLVPRAPAASAVAAGLTAAAPPEMPPTARSGPNGPNGLQLPIGAPVPVASTAAGPDPAQTAWPATTAALPSRLSAADTDALLQALVEQLHVDYLRHYGSAG